MSLSEMLSQMELAADFVKNRLSELDQTAKAKMEECNSIVDSLSDLRYKKLSGGTVDECLEGLAVSACYA